MVHQLYPAKSTATSTAPQATGRRKGKGKNRRYIESFGYPRTEIGWPEGKTESNKTKASEYRPKSGDLEYPNEEFN